MPLIQANRESIDDRFSVLGFTVRTENPLFEIALAAHPDLLKGANRAKRTAGNFFSSRLLGASRRGESVYLVPPHVVARFIGQPRLYFGLATYREGDRSRPVTVKVPDAGNMYVNTSGLTERGLRRTARAPGAGSYGGGGEGLGWGGDALVAAAEPAAPAARGGNGAAAAPAAPPTYSDGYSDDLWKHDNAAPAPAPASAPAQAQARPLLVEPYDQPSSSWDALTTQVAHFARGAMWFLGVADTRQPPYSAICQVRRPDGSAEGAHMGTAFFIGPRLLLTAAHVVDGQSELIIVPGKNGAGTGRAAEPFGRFRTTQLRKHASYGTDGHDHDMALICVPEAHAARAPNYFGRVEELTQSRPEGVVVSGYAAWWHATDAIEEFVNNHIDENRQHAHGGHIRELPTEGTFTYDLQTLAGTSGSPVYWIEDGAVPTAHLVGVHVAANDDRTNRGCRITQEKLAWIRATAAAWGQSLTFSLGARALENEAPPVAEDDPDAIGIGEDEPVPADAPPAGALRSLALDNAVPDYPAASRFVPAHARNFTRGRRRDRVVDRIVIHITAGGPSINGTIAWFQNGERVNPRTGNPIRSSAHYVVGRDGEVVQMVRNADTAHHASAANSRSIGIEHNANKPSSGNKRDLPPTEPQYEASARLVAWLCQQYGLPADREHIRGHMEISPGDNHDCPSSIWDWDHYMACVRLATESAAAATAQALGARRPHATAQEIITPFYDPADPSTALSCQNDAFSVAREEWFAGVPNTSIFPHSAICQLIMTAPNGNQYQGTGFYIGRNRILTCAHNLHGKISVQIIPGRNGALGLPFGQCSVDSSSWRVAPRYSGPGDWDNDLAVIDNVPIAAPHGLHFDFLRATPSDRLPVVVCGYSTQSVAVPGLTDIIDGDMQHLHGGYVREQPTPETIDYPILSLKGASGSPVYTLTGSGGGVQARICAVHVSGEPAAHGLNRGCFVTPAKIDWIEGRAASFALDARNAPRRGGVVRVKPASRAQGLTDLLPVDLKIRVFIPAPVAVVTIPGIGGLMPGQSAHGGDGRGFQLDGGTSRAEIAARFHFGGEGGHSRLTDVRRSFGESANYDTGDTVAVPGKPEWYRDLRPGAQPIERGTQSVTDGKLRLELGGGSFHGILSMAENAVVVTFNIHASDPIVTGAPDIDATLALLIKIDGDRVKVRVNGGHDEFPAYEIYANGALVYSYDPITAGGTPWGLFGDGNWDVNPDTRYVDVGPATEYRIIGPVRIGTSQGVASALQAPRPAASRTLATEPDYAVPLIPQPDKNACWAASMAMLLSYRRGASFSPETLANEVGGSLASSYSWDLLDAVRSRYGFEMIAQPSNTSLYHSPQQWADWLGGFGPLWVVIVGAPHAVVVAGIRGNLADPASVQVRILNPWDTRAAFDNDPVAFRPRNGGYEDWLPFTQFAADFGSMAEPDYGNWRVLHLPARSATAQSLASEGEPIEPSRIAGTRMRVLRGSADAVRWSLDRLEGSKPPRNPGPAASATSGDVVIDLDDWPAFDGTATPLPLRIVFHHTTAGGVGQVHIEAASPADPARAVEVTARIEDEPDAGNVAALKVVVDYRFGAAHDAPTARTELRLLGDGRYERASRWLATKQAA